MFAPPIRLIFEFNIGYNLAGGVPMLSHSLHSLWLASIALLTTSAIPVAAADEAATAETAETCVRTQSIDDWRPVDRSAIIVRVSTSKSYKVAFASPCKHMKWSVLARVDTRPTAGAPCLARGDIILFGRGPRKADNSFEKEQRCTVKSVEPFEEPAQPPASPSN
jgi:Family of unknown function (DUF6491)